MPSQQQAQNKVTELQMPRVVAEAAQATRVEAPDRTRQERSPRPRPVRVACASVGAPPKRRRSWTYVKHALMHPWHVVVLAGATVFGVANWSLLVLMAVFAGAELLLLGVVLRTRAFRRYVDERLDQVERGLAAEQRATLLLRMSDEHRRELLRLELIVDHIRQAVSPHGTAAQVAVEECLRLLASYVRLALVHNTSRECLASVNRRALEDEIRTLEAARFSQGHQARALTQRRIRIARKRAERWDKSRETLDAITHQLAMISELVQLTHEQIAAPADPGGATDEIDCIVEELDENHSTLEELAEFLGVEETIDPRVLDMGRAAKG